MVVHKMSFWSQLNPTWQQVQLRYKHNCMYQTKKYGLIILVSPRNAFWKALVSSLQISAYVFYIDAIQK